MAIGLDTSCRLFLRRTRIRANPLPSVFKHKLDWMVTELATCQDAISSSMDVESPGGVRSSSSHPGYLGAVPEYTVLRLGPPRWEYGSNPDIDTWAPWYTQHKIMRGLLDVYYNTDNSQA